MKFYLFYKPHMELQADRRPSIEKENDLWQLHIMKKNILGCILNAKNWEQQLKYEEQLACVNAKITTQKEIVLVLKWGMPATNSEWDEWWTTYPLFV